MDGWMDGWLAGWLAGWVGGWVDGWMAGWLAGWLAGWVGGWMDGMDGSMDGWMDFFFPTHLFLPASQHWDRLGPGYRPANLYKLLGWGGYKSRAAGPPSRSKREA